MPLNKYLIFLLFVWGATAEAQVEVPVGRPVSLIERILPETREIVGDLLRDHPKDRWFFLCPGRSPLPLCEGLRLERGDSSVRNVPLSGVKYLRMSELTDPPNEKWAQVLRVLGAYLPSVEELSGRNVLVLDFMNTGESFDRQMKIIDAAFKYRDGRSPPLTGKAYYYSPKLVSIEALGRYMVDFLQAPPQLADVWIKGSGDFDLWGEFEAWEPFQDAVPIRNPNHGLFRQVFESNWSASPTSVCDQPLKWTKRWKAIMGR